MRRVSIVGSPGSGKTTLGRQLAKSLGLPYVELDSIFHQPGWTELANRGVPPKITDIVASG